MKRNGLRLGIPEGSRYAINFFCLFIVLVETEFVYDVSQDEQATGQPDRQSKQIDKGDELVFAQIAQCDDEIITGY